MPSLLSIKFDVDAYLAKGGKLLDLQMSTEEEVRAAVEAGAIPAERVARVGRFFSRLSKAGPANVVVRSVLGEETLRRFWRETAKSSS